MFKATKGEFSLRSIHNANTRLNTSLDYISWGLLLFLHQTTQLKMRRENIQAWAEDVEFGHPPPSQPPFDQYGTPIFSYRDAKDYLNRMGNRVAEIAVRERASRHQRNGEVKDPELPNTQKTVCANQDAEAYLERQRKILFQNVGGKDLKQVQRVVPPNQDREAYMNQIRKRQAEIAEQERIVRQRKVLFPNSVPEDVKPGLGPYRIPTRKPVPKSNDNTSAPAPQMVLLRNGQTRKLENIPSYAERVREQGSPETLCPPSIADIGDKNSLRIDCTDGKVGFEKYAGQNRHQDQRTRTPGDTGGTHSPRNCSLAPGTSPAPGKALPPGPSAAADRTEAMIRDLVDMGLVE